MKKIEVRGIAVPTFLYGTAWKEERTEALVGQALAAGFRGIDTANQRKHYHEAGVGAALARLSQEERSGVFLQTKFTHRSGQDDRLAYDPAANPVKQVRQSFKSSLKNLGVAKISSLILHGPELREGLSPADRDVWRTCEELRAEGRVLLLGISNVTASQLAELYDLAAEPPDFVQNRCYARQGWDRPVRTLCRREGVVYQGFSLLTANRAELRIAKLVRIAARHKKTPEQIIFAFARSIGMIRLTGSSDPEHLRQDLDSDAIELASDEIAAIESISG